MGLRRDARPELAPRSERGAIRHQKRGRHRFVAITDDDGEEEEGKGGLSGPDQQGQSPRSA